MSKFPGPKTWAASKIPMMMMQWGGDVPIIMAGLHDKYGPVVRVGPTEISYNDPQAWKDIYGHRVGSKQSFQKDPEHYLEGSEIARSIINSEDADHSRHRRILANSFSDKALKEQEPLLRQWADLLVAKLKELEAAGKPADMVSYYNFTTFDVMADLTFAEPLNMLNGSTYSPWVAAIFGHIKIAARVRALKHMPGFDKLMKLCMTDGMKAQAKEHNDFSVERVDRRLAKEPGRPDLWTEVLKRSGTDKVGSGMSLHEMHANSNIFMIAGTETTATLLSGVTYFLIRDEDRMAKLMKELREAFQKPDDITVETMAKLPYLNACLEEAMRMYPPVPTGLPRVTPPGGAPICGEHVPGGTIVSVDQFSTYHSERNFRRHSEFIPERWLGDAEFADDARSCFQPFSTGPRNCIGRNLAYHEARLLLTMVLWHFELSLDDADDLWNEQKIFILWEKRPLNVKLKSVR
uniref:CYP65EW3 n=1 Tax=Hormonema carpetanum TaxID=284138 RepID=A0A897Q0P2_HORCR|nr:CYP65EW3 [Hormonema carpetanum]